MAYAMTKRGSLDNCITYEFICDTVQDMNAIENGYRTIGTVAIVLSGADEGLEVYMSGSDHEWVSLSSMGTSGGGATGGLSIYICAQNEVSNGLPNIQDPDETTIYLVASGNDSGNLYEEYIYVDDAWEKFGSGGATIDLSNYVTKTDNATYDTLGLVKAWTGGGIGLSASPEDGRLYIYGAQLDTIKQGTHSYQPIVPGHQHQSVFYGLAKAAGDSTQAASDNAVGTYTASAKTAIKNMLGISEVDVQVNNTSIVSNGVANIPYATINDYGLVKIGEGLEFTSSNNKLRIASAGTGTIKAGGSTTYPVVPAHQHEAVFYGLAKAAGVDMKNSENTVGTYTAEAQAAIQAMLGIVSASGVSF